jgi:hypothetical protein
LLGPGAKPQIRRRETSEQYVQTLLQIPEHIKVESIIAIGYPAETREPLPCTDLKDTKSTWHLRQIDVPVS